MELPFESTLEKMMRMYAKEGSRYVVLLQNINGMAGLARSGGILPGGMTGSLSDMSMGEFTLNVILVQK
jgi:hypothetical protein